MSCCCLPSFFVERTGIELGETFNEGIDDSHAVDSPALKEVQQRDVEDSLRMVVSSEPPLAIKAIQVMTILIIYHHSGVPAPRRSK